MSDTLTSEWTLRQIVRAHPAAQRVLQVYPSSRIDGIWSLQELGPFAAQVGVPVDRLLADLSTATGVPTGAVPRRKAAGDGAVATMLVALLISLTLGAGWGVYLLLSISFAADYQAVTGQWVHVHGIEQLWGWVGLTIFGVASYLLHQTAKSKPPAWLGRLSRGALVTGLLLVAATLVLGPAAGRGYVAIAGSCLLLIAALSFALDVVWSLSGRMLDAGLLFVLVSVQWLLVWAAADVTTRWLFRGQPQPSDEARTQLIQLPVLGFFANMIFGFGIRLIPGLLNITRPRHRAFLVTIPLYNLGLIVLLAAPPLQRVGVPALLVAWLGVAGAAAMWFAALIYAAGMRFFRPTPPVRPIHGVDPRGGVLVPIAYAWFLIALAMIVIERLAIGLGMPLAHPFAGAYRHALTVGFVTTMILAVAQRLVPVFVRQELITPRAFLLTAVLIVVGNAWRVGCELWTLSGSEVAYRLMGVSGPLELAAIALFALTVLRTLGASRLHYQPGTPITPGTRVREALNAYPHLQHTLRGLEIDMLDDAAFVAPSMRVGGMAIACLWPPAELAAKLDAARGS